MRHEQYLYTHDNGRLAIEHFVNGWGKQLHKRPGEFTHFGQVVKVQRLTNAQYKEIIRTNEYIPEKRPDGLYRGWTKAHSPA